MVLNYGVLLEPPASTSNIAIIQRFQSEILRTLTSVQWYVRKETFHHDLSVRTMREEMKYTSDRYLL